MTTEVVQAGLDREAIKNEYDVLMDGYTFYTNIKTYDDAAQIAVAALTTNPTANVQVRKTEKHQQWIRFTRGVPRDHQGMPTDARAL